MAICKQVGVRRVDGSVHCELRAGIGPRRRTRRGDPQGVTEAAVRYPDVSSPDNQRARTDVYRSCMAAAGQAP